MTASEYTERLRRFLMERGIVANVADIEATLPLALSELGKRKASSLDYAGFEKDFTVSISGGVASLNSHTTMLKEHIRQVKDANGEYWSRLPNASRSDLLIPRIEFFWYYILTVDAIEAKKGDGSTVPDDGDLTVTASSVPTIEEVTDEEDAEMLVMIGAEYYEGREAAA